MHKTPHPRPHAQPAPDQRPLSALQAKRLSSLTGVAAKEIAGARIADLSDRLRWEIDPFFLLFERICGQVVKKDPHTGIDSPVPFATVHVYDVDCSFFGYFPRDWPWSWFFPFHCEREELATVTADACGHFCVWVPRFEIEWIRRWRLERICIPDIFRRPTIGDIVEQTIPPFKTNPNPPDPPALLADGGMTYRRLGEVLGTQQAEQLLRVSANRTAGGDAKAYRRLAGSTAFRALPPPLPAHVHERFRAEGPQALARHLSLDGAKAERFDPARYAGPFGRCTDVLVPEWLPVLEVPDIAFKVTQNIGGVDQTIYDDGYFDVDWESGDLSNVTLHARPNAVATFSCDAPAVDCSQQGILFAGLMPLTVEVPDPVTMLPVPKYHDAVSGFAVRPNRPHDPVSGSPTLPSYAPYTGTVQLYGCNHAPGASFYRVGYRHNGTSGIFTGVGWTLWPMVVNPMPFAVTPDADGWYAVAVPADVFPEHLLFEWTTGASGPYELWLEYGDAGKNVIGESAHLTITVDNDPIAATFTQLRWRPEGGAWSAPMELVCPVITRPMSGGQPQTIYLEVSYLASTTYFRSVSLAGNGCGGGNVLALDPPTSTHAAHWYAHAGDTGVSDVAVFKLDGSNLQGAYSFSLDVVSRAFNPAGGDGGREADWLYDPVYRQAIPSLPIAIVNAVAGP